MIRFEHLPYKNATHACSELKEEGISVTFGISPECLCHDVRDNVRRVRALEDAGFDYIWEGDHTLPWQHSSGHSSGIFTTLAAFLAETERAVVGGMVIPALIYLLLNPERPARDGWGVPMATDIAFAVGVLALLGRRVPAAIRVLLLAVAIIDDIGAIVVIALFYSTGVVWTGLALAGGGIAIVIVLQRTGVRPPLAYVPPGAISSRASCPRSTCPRTRSIASWAADMKP